MLRGYDHLGRFVGQGFGRENGKWEVVVCSVSMTLADEVQAKSALGVFGAVSFCQPETVHYDDDYYGSEAHGRGHAY